MPGIGRAGQMTAGLLLPPGVPRPAIGGVLHGSRGFAMPETIEQRCRIEGFHEVLKASR